MINKENVELLKKLVDIHIENLAKEYPEYTTCVSAAAHSFSFCIFNSDSGDDVFKKQINVKSANQDAVKVDLELCVKACGEWL